MGEGSSRGRCGASLFPGKGAWKARRGEEGGKGGRDIRTFGGEEEAAEHDGPPRDSDEGHVGYLHQSERGVWGVRSKGV